MNFGSLKSNIERFTSGQYLSSVIDCSRYAHCTIFHVMLICIGTLPGSNQQIQPKRSCM
ncbi:hypothetical protein RDI58_022295 [Solanum bulbocastanum]|uniref:Uncharacterized protein n=1 Tax=Solanum bulbocastanum TaxID=147425 RepID=A0AAN8TAB1_SOLBU